MIPADVASRLQVSADSALRPVAPTQEIVDKLSGLVAGQKVMAEIQAMLPNGTYRAMINQRNITLALPFAAKSGDSLELQVTESDGKLALAVVSRADGESAKAAAASTSATLSRTGQLISTLFSGAREAKEGAVALPLNGKQPIASAPPNSASDLLPLLKQAITQSGMFYEAHQAEWVQGRFTKSALLQEPQGKLSLPAAFAAALAEDQASATLLKASAAPGTNEAGSPATAKAAGATGAGEAATAGALKTAVQAGADQPGSAAHLRNPAPAGSGDLATARFAADAAPRSAESTAAQTAAQVVAPQTQAVVQQQLDALATQNFAWQGQVWPGQEMRWEIDEDAARYGQEDDEAAAKWTTRLNLTLPNLGDIAAQIRLQGNQVSLTMSAGNAETRALIRAASLTLRSQLDDVGLTLATLGIDAATESRGDGQAGE